MVNILSTPVRLLPLAASVAWSQIAAASEHRLYSRQTSGVGFEGSDMGCYASPGGEIHDVGDYTWQSVGYCGKQCYDIGKPVMALQGQNCFCGYEQPSPTEKLDASECSEPCPGYTENICGGSQAYAVWLTGINMNPPTAGEDGDNTSSAKSKPSSTSKSPVPKPTHHHHHHHHAQKHSSSTKKIVVKTTTHTSVYTSAPTTTLTSPSNNHVSKPESDSSSSSSGMSSTIAIAVGVIVGVVAFAGLVAGILFCIRRRRRQKNVETGHRRAESLNAFVASGAPTPGTLAGRLPHLSMSDNRLDPRIMQETRRDSSASYLADNEDYSRRILKVTNPDG